MSPFLIRIMKGINMDHCIFCQIARGEIPCHKVYEDDKILAFLDISQTTRGHTLIITKEHFDNFLFVPKDLLGQAISVAQKIAQAEVTSLGAQGVNILINSNKAAGQTVMHFHIHAIPRYDERDHISIQFQPNAIEKLNLPALAKEIGKDL